MKHILNNKPALLLLISGLILTSLTPIVARYYPLPDNLKEFITGIGLMLEVLALVKIEKFKGEGGVQISE
jgi:hypothetical protein